VRALLVDERNTLHQISGKDFAEEITAALDGETGI
jgi:hypothetical protein